MENELVRKVTLAERLTDRIDRMNISPWLKMVFFGLPPMYRKKSVKKAGADIDINSLLQEFVSNPENISQDFTFSSMASSLSIPKSALKDYFQFELMMDFRTWKSERKMDLAQKMIVENPQMPMGEIGQALGYKDTSNFYRSFRSRTGLTPSQWKRERAGVD